MSAKPRVTAASRKTKAAAAPKVGAKGKDDTAAATKAAGANAPSTRFRRKTKPVNTTATASTAAINGTAAPAEANGQAHVIEVPMSALRVHPDEFRDDTDSEGYRKHVHDVADTMKDLGLLQPIVVRAVGEEYEVVAGRVRVAAAASLGWTTIPAMLHNFDDVHAQLAAIIENLSRREYRNGQFDLAVRRMKELYEAIYPETRQYVAAGKGNKKASANGEAAAADGAAAPRRKTFAQVLADQTGSSKRQVQRAVRRAKVFTEDDFKIFKARDIGQVEQNTLASISDTAKRQEIIMLVERGVPFQKAYDNALGIKTQDVEANAAANEQAPTTDDEWLESLGEVRTKVQTKFFDAQALCYRRLGAIRETLAKAYKKTNKEFPALLVNKNGYMAKVNTFLKLKHPKDWQRCGQCQGKGQAGGAQCLDCYGGGFVMD